MEENLKSWVERLESLRKCMLEPEKCPHEGGCDYAAIDMCLIQIVSEMEDCLKPAGNVVKELPVFKGYTVDERLREFRKMDYGQIPEFIPFDSPEGHDLLSAYRKQKVRSSNLK